MNKKHFKKTLRPLIVIVFLFLTTAQEMAAQTTEDQVGAWYMYFFNKDIESNRFGVQGDIQFRNWDLGSDLEQLLLRGGLTFRPKETDVKLTAGVGHITSGAFGESKSTTEEIRIYQEALLPQKIGGRLKLTHRFRFEQRTLKDQDLRTRYRYNLFATIPLNGKQIGKGVIYTSFYNELFINGQKNIGNAKQVSLFDRNRTYIALGYVLADNLKVQLGIMRQSLDSFSKDQLQISLHHNW